MRTRSRSGATRSMALAPITSALVHPNIASVFGDGGSCDASCGTAFDYTPDAAEGPQGPSSGDTLISV